MARLPYWSLIGVLILCTSPAQSLVRRELGTIPLGATAFAVCHGNVAARQSQEYISAEPFPIVVRRGFDPAALETFNGASDTPEPQLSAEFRQHLETALGAPATAECHLSESTAAAQSLIEFWQGQYGPPANAPPQALAWAPPVVDAPPVRQRGRRQAAQRPPPEQLGAN